MMPDLSAFQSSPAHESGCALNLLNLLNLQRQVSILTRP